jgi:FkbM family methyltransferase
MAVNKKTMKTKKSNNERMSLKTYYYFLELIRIMVRSLKIEFFPVYIRRHNIYVRTNNSVDLEVVRYVFEDLYHRPFRDLESDNSVILDLGTNIGCSILDMKDIFPSAKIIGCEMDTDNFNLALKNCKKINDVTILNNAVWFEDGIVQYYKGANTFSNSDAFSIIKREQPSSVNEVRTISVKSISIDSIIQSYNLEKIDYVKMDIEGAELEVILINNQWLNIVWQIKIEYHNGEDDAKKIKEVLLKKGFNVFKDTSHPSTLNAYRV